MRTDKMTLAFAYLRLSNEEAREGESSSISSQEDICQGGFHPKDEIPPDKLKVEHFTSATHTYQ